MESLKVELLCFYWMTGDYNLENMATAGGTNQFWPLGPTLATSV